MSQELHIVRVPESDENQISANEWLNCISEDPEMERKQSSEVPEGWIVATVSGAEEWETLYWRSGSISATYPQSRLTSKMLDLAERLSAVAMTDDGIILRRGEGGKIECDEF
jgi:hypothetical protein